MASSANSSCAARGPRKAEPEDALEVSEQHLDALAIAAGLLERFRFGQRSSHVSSVFVDVSHDPAGRHVRAAFWLEPASPAHRHGCDVARRMVAADRTRCPQDLARRTNVDVLRLVEREVFPRERTVLSFGLVDHRDVRGDLLLVDQPVEVRR